MMSISYYTSCGSTIGSCVKTSASCASPTPDQTRMVPSKEQLMRQPCQRIIEVTASVWSLTLNTHCAVERLHTYTQ